MKYLKEPMVSGVTRFTKAPMSEVEFSRMKVASMRYTTFNAGDIVPLYYAEILPHDTEDISVDYVLRQLTLLKPAMGDLNLDIFAFWVSNQTVNESWKNVQGENTSGIWSAPEVELAPLVAATDVRTEVQIPVGSLADYYGFPTQAPIRTVHLKQMNDLKQRGYVEIYNTYFRDQNYQAPIPYSKLNVYEGFLLPRNSTIGSEFVPSVTAADGSYPAGAIVKSLFGDGSTNLEDIYLGDRLTGISFLDPPLKANKYHDPFTSALPSPQKSADVVFSIGDTAPIDTSSETHEFDGPEMLLASIGTSSGIGGYAYINRSNQAVSIDTGNSQPNQINASNLVANLSTATGLSVNDLRTAVATQQVYEALARGGSRYHELIRTFFEIETETPFTNMPIQLGHIRNVLDMYQVAQTSGSVEGETPQGNLTAFGYTTKGGKLFHRTFLEHGYIHILGVVRQKNIYTTYLGPDNFRRSTLDFYLPQFANIGEQPIPLRTLNPFIAGHDDGVIAYQEAWWEYRYEPDCASGYFRQGLPETLTGWTYGDPFDPNFTHVNGEWLKSNAQEVVDKTLSVTSELAHQFFGVFTFIVDKQRPLPVYSVPGLDMI